MAACAEEIYKRNLEPHLVVRLVEGVGRGPLPWAEVPEGVHVLGAGRPCVAPCRQGQGGGGRAGEGGGGGGRAVPVPRAVAIALAWQRQTMDNKHFFKAEKLVVRLINIILCLFDRR